jgi:hypothetical protein
MNFKFNTVFFGLLCSIISESLQRKWYYNVFEEQQYNKSENHECKTRSAVQRPFQYVFIMFNDGRYEKKLHADGVYPNLFCLMMFFL